MRACGSDASERLIAKDATRRDISLFRLTQTPSAQSLLYTRPSIRTGRIRSCLRLHRPASVGCLCRRLGFAGAGSGFENWQPCQKKYQRLSYRMQCGFG
jgi:hypothetical protein